MRRLKSLWWMAPAVLLSATGCGNSSGKAGPAPSASAATSAASSSDVLVTVNGAPIRVGELHYFMSRKKGQRLSASDAPALKEALEELVDQEIARQSAASAGLDADAEYRKKYRFMEAPFVQFQREELAKMYMRREAAAKSRVEEPELRKYFDTHAASLKTELHLQQILIRNDEAKIRELKKKIDGGAKFEEVAATLFPPNLPADNSTPWDLGTMRWTEVPATWRSALEKMKEGEVSDVIAGPKGRFWLVKLMTRKTNEALTFEQLKADITSLVQAEKSNADGALKAELRKKATIVRVNEAAAVPAPTQHD